MSADQCWCEVMPLLSVHNLLQVDLLNNIRHFFHIHTEVGNNGISANSVFPYIISFYHYLYLNMLVNVKLDQVVKGITFQGYRL